MKYKIIIIASVLIALAVGAFIFFGRGEKALDAEAAESVNDDDKKAIEDSPSEPGIDAAEHDEEKFNDEVGLDSDSNDAEEPAQKSAQDLTGPKEQKIREAMHGKVHANIKRVYGDLYENLGLSSAEEEKINSLLAERTLSAMEMAMSFFKKGDSSAEDRTKKIKELAAMKEDSNRALKSMLGEEKYAKFERYEETKGQRQYVKSMAAKADKAGAKIPRDVQDRLTDIMHEEQAKLTKARESMDPTKFDKESLKKMMEEHEKINNNILSRFKKELSPEQFEVFNNMQK